MRLHRTLRAVAVLMLLPAFAVGPGLLRAQPADRFAAVAPRMQEFVDKGEVAGVVTLIATREGTIHLGAVGKTDMAGDRKMRADDIFWIASMSKPITAVCIAILADEGKLRFDDPLAKHLPEFASLMVNEDGQTVNPLPPGYPPRCDDAHQWNRRDHQSGAAPHTGRNQPAAGPPATALSARQPLGILHGGHRHTRARRGGGRRHALRRVPPKACARPVGHEATPASGRAGERTVRWAHAIARKRTCRSSSKRPPSLICMELPSPTGSVPRWVAPGCSRQPLTSPAFYRMLLNQGTLNGKRILKPATVAEMTRKQTGALNARPGHALGTRILRRGGPVEDGSQ